MQLAPLDNSRELYKRITAPNKRLTIIKDGTHYLSVCFPFWFLDRIPCSDGGRSRARRVHQILRDTRISNGQQVHGTVENVIDYVIDQDEERLGDGSC